MSAAPDPTMLTWLADNLWAPFLAVVSGIGKVTFGLIHARIEHVEAKAENALSKIDFKEYVDRSETSRKELRDGLIGVYKSIDELKTLIISQK
jgi:hypothetical protein